MQQEIDKLDIFLGQAENDWDLPVPVCIFSSFLQLILPFFRSQTRVMNNLKLSLVHEQFLHSDDDELVNLFSINRSSVWGSLHELWAWEIQVLQTLCTLLPLLPLTIKRIRTDDEEGK